MNATIPAFPIQKSVILHTATGKEQALVDFYAQLARDGHTVTTLAEKARVGRASLTEVFNCRRTGKNTWKHILPLLSSEALSLLSQCSSWNRYAAHEWKWLLIERERKRIAGEHGKAVEILCAPRQSGPPYVTGGIRDLIRTLP